MEFHLLKNCIFKNNRSISVPCHRVSMFLSKHLEHFYLVHLSPNWHRPRLSYNRIFQSLAKFSFQIFQFFSWLLQVCHQNYFFQWVFGACPRSQVSDKQSYLYFLSLSIFSSIYLVTGTTCFSKAAASSRSRGKPSMRNPVAPSTVSAIFLARISSTTC